MRLGAREVFAYILSKMGCVHPFVASRVAALADLASLEERGERLTQLRYRQGPGVIYIEGLKELVEGDPCFAKHEGDPSTGRRGCIEYRCEPPRLPQEAAELLDRAVDEARGLDEAALNEKVVGHPLFPKLVEAA